MLVDKLGRWSPADTPAILYEAATLPIESFRAERVVLAQLPDAAISTATTLVISPPCGIGRFWASSPQDSLPN
jgi:hypothetical protein